MSALLSKVTNGERLSHIGRFALVSFLSNGGVSEEEILRILHDHDQTEFTERIARYQVEHISGSRGGKKYTPPSCRTMQAHDLCTNPDAGCTMPAALLVDPTATINLCLPKSMMDDIDRIRVGSRTFCIIELLDEALENRREKSKKGKETDADD